MAEDKPAAPVATPKEAEPKKETEIAFYCSAPSFCVQKEGEPRVLFDGRWLVTSDKELIKYVKQLSKDFQKTPTVQPITLMEVPIETVGIEPPPEVISEYHKPSPPEPQPLKK